MRHEHDFGDDDDGASAGAFVLTRTGAVGYLVDQTPGIRGLHHLEVWRMDARGRRRLDAGFEIDGASLKLRRSRLTWLHAGRPRAATLR